jgi:RNA polymerase sigma factor (sigma-70 family)
LAATTKRERELKPESFAALLNWLGPGEQGPGSAYEQIRQRLIRLFTCRGCSTPEELTDETIDRVINILQKPEFQYHGDPALYFYGVARNVYLEWLRRERRYVMEPIEETTIDKIRGSGLGSNDVERQHDCLERCLERLPKEKRTLLLQYYGNEGGGKIDQRKTLARRNGLGLNAMRIQLYRLRTAIGDCVSNCLQNI